MTGIFNGIGRFFEATFGPIEAIGGVFNVLIMLVIFIATCIWIKRMFDYNKEAERNNTLK